METRRLVPLQVEAFYVLNGTLHVETPDEENVVEADQALFVDPGNSQRHSIPSLQTGPFVCSPLAYHLSMTRRNMIQRLTHETLRYSSATVFY